MGSNGKITPKEIGITLPSLPRTGRATLMAIQRYEPRTWRVMNSASLACLVDRFTGCPTPRFRRQATRSRDHDDRETNIVSLCQNSATANASHYFRQLFSSRGSGTHRYQFPRRTTAARDCPATYQPRSRLAHLLHDLSSFSRVEFRVNLGRPGGSVTQHNARCLNAELLSQECRRVMPKPIR